MNRESEGLPERAPELLAVTTRLLSEQYRAKQNRRLNSDVFSAARKKAALASTLELRKQLSNLISAAGIDVERIKEGLDHDRLALREHVNRQAQNAMAGAAEIRQRHIIATEERAARLQALSQFGVQGTDYELLKIAASIDALPQSILKIAPVITALENVARLKVEISGDGPFVGPDQVLVNWHFSYVPSRTGLLNVVASLLVNGFASMWTDPLIIPGPFVFDPLVAAYSLGAPRNAEVEITAKILLFQANPTTAGVPVYDSSPTVFWMFEYLDSPPYDDLLGKNLSYPYDDQQTLVYNNQFVVIAGAPVDIVVQVSLRVDERGGSALLDLESAPNYGLNVPFVLAALT